MTFESWLNEIEVFSLRAERLSSDCDAGMDYNLALKWLEAAYEAGYNASWEDNYKDWVKFGYVYKP